jgi:hypothetical protein
MTFACMLVWQGRLDEAEVWIGHTERTVRAEAEPTTAGLAYYGRGLIELACGHDAAALVFIIQERSPTVPYGQTEPEDAEPFVTATVKNTSPQPIYNAELYWSTMACFTGTSAPLATATRTPIASAPSCPKARPP